MISHNGLALLVTLVLLTSPVASNAQEAPKGRVHVTVTDNEGNPLAYRGYLTDANGIAVFPTGVVIFERKSPYAENHFLSRGVLNFFLPPGKYTIRAERGIEWLPEEHTFQVRSADQAEIHLTMQRRVDMNGLGWYSGDLHIHRTPGDASVAILAEDLNFGANAALWNEKNAFADANRDVPEAPYLEVAPGQVLNTRAQETERLGTGWGAALFLGDYTPVDLPSDIHYPLLSVVCAAAKAAGAHVDFEKPVWRATPVCAALGLVDSIGVVNNHFHPRAYLSMSPVRKAIIPPRSIEMRPREGAHYILGLYDHLLNCGLRIPVSAGSASGVMPSWVGYERTYVHLEEPFTPEAWLRALRAGRSFATNGPILLLKAAGAVPGDIHPLASRRMPLRVQVEATSSSGKLELIEIVHNGEVIAHARSTAGVAALGFDQSVEVGPGWLAARCFEKEGITQVYAATSPVYLEHQGDRGTVAASGRYYANFLQDLIDQVQRGELMQEPHQIVESVQILQRAKQFYDGVAQQGKAS